MTEIIKFTNKRPKSFFYKGKEVVLTVISKEKGFCFQTIGDRITRGVTEEELFAPTMSREAAGRIGANKANNKEAKAQVVKPVLDIFAQNDRRLAV